MVCHDSVTSLVYKEMNWQTSEANAYDAWQFDLLVALICVLYVYIVALSQQTELACGACHAVCCSFLYVRPL